MGRNWKVLGEVPDSDDEELDSQEPPRDDPAGEDDSQEPPCDGPSGENDTAAAALSSGNRASGREQTTPRDQTPAPAPSLLRPFSPLDDDGLDDEVDLVDAWEDELGQGQAQTHPQPLSQHSQRQPPAHTSQRMAANEARVLSLSPMSSLSAFSHSPSLLLESPPPPAVAVRASSPTRSSTPAPSFPMLPDSPPSLRLDIVRSLRPRKPIQQHPYLLENAKYAQVMKSHGVKPVRVAFSGAGAGGPKRHAADEEDSQEQEFELPDDESQGPRPGPAPRQSDASVSRDSVYDFPTSSPPDRRHDTAPSSLSPRISTPAHRLLPPSSPDAAADGTDNTSPPDDNDDDGGFPSLRPFLPAHRGSLHGRVSKRRSPPRTTSAASVKRAQAAEHALQQPPQATPPPRWIPVPVDSSPDQLPRSSARAYRTASHAASPTVHSTQRETPILDDDGNDRSSSASSDNEDAGHGPDGDDSSADGDESDSEVVRENSRRIRGVLPASWLRLDQQKATARVAADRLIAAKRRTGAQPDLAPRKGVALPRQAHGSGSLADLAPLFDDSDDDNESADTPIDQLADGAGSRPRPSRVEPWPDDSADEGDDAGPAAALPAFHLIDDDDIGSVMEEDVIDIMAPSAGRKRSSLGDGPRPKKRHFRASPNPFRGVPGEKTRQPKITRMLERSGSSVAVATAAGHPSTTRRHPHASSRRSRGRVRKPPATPPLLSILDFVEPAAPVPNFIRIAARTARSKPRLGKTSPSRKVINLGSRADNVDALSVLHDWRAGHIRPRIPNPPKRSRQAGQQQQHGQVQQQQQQQQPPLQELSANTTRQSKHAGPKDSTLSAECPQMAGATPSSRPGPPKKAFVNTASRIRPAAQKPRREEGGTVRPAQLETTSTAVRLGPAALYGKKKALDEMYRRRQKQAPALPSVRLERFFDDLASVAGSVGEAESSPGLYEPMDVELAAERPPSPPLPPPANDRQRSRFRKRYRPRPVDTTAPRFVHALDPLPVDVGPPAVAADVADPDAGKLRGLGPFGSQYSLHFDVFPLDGGVFFHESTLLGSGRLRAVLETGCQQPPLPTTALVSTFQLDERTLRWSTWDDVASSEFGILLDWLADGLFPSDTAGAASAAATTAHGSYLAVPRVHAVVYFLVDFVQTTVAAPDAAAAMREAFVLRGLEAIGSLVGRFARAATAMPGVDTTTNSHLAALTGLLVVAAWLVRLCRDTPACGAHAMRAEELLLHVAHAAARALVQHGVRDLRAGYDEVQQQRFLARGIRRDMQALGSWVVLQQVLEHARMPRAGFWDVAYAALLGGNGSSRKDLRACTDAGELEQLWEGMFVLLPLCEFDSSGVVQAGLRRLVPVEGWALPKMALERVFALYKANHHQAASFNAYCRALLGRCHWLVQEWGWRRCQGIVGTIFDFYGSQDFAHLRNEEVYQSPKFLEALAEESGGGGGGVDGSTAASLLAVDAEDKCFHVFIKMLGLVIVQLRRLGLGKEMRNLVARMLPNHDRQYRKEKDVHQRDLAALRNHHDLLCTLFWAASAEARPPLHQIERLVVPAQAHKEACLINVRAWWQLARYVMAADEGHGVYRGFRQWMRSIFQQVLEQYLTAEVELQRQFRDLSSSLMRGVGPEMLQAMAASNRAAAMEVLQACAAASLDALRQARSLGAATYCLPTDQLEAVFGRMELVSGTAARNDDWRILATALDTLEHYVDRLEKAVDEQFSSAAAAAADSDAAADTSNQADEAVLMLDHTVAKSFFRLTHAATHASWADLPPRVAAARRACTERAVVLAGRLASRFVHAGVYGLGRFFGMGPLGGPPGGVVAAAGPEPGGYSVFERLPHGPGLEGPRRYLPLFVSAVVGSSVFDWKELGTSILEQWLLALVKPERVLGYELRLAAVLRQHGLPYVGDSGGHSTGTTTATTTTTAATTTTTAATTPTPTYATNRALFARAMAWMWQQLRDAEAAVRRQALRGEFARALRRVMQQMKEDLQYDTTAAGAAGAAKAHDDYVDFVRSIVALIRSHGSDICALDGFFYAASAAYTPSPEDPQLEAATIVMYGLRLGAGEATAVPQLFHYLHNSFSIALAGAGAGTATADGDGDGKLAQEGAILARSMAEHGAVLGFVLGRMLPAALAAARAADGACALVLVYGGAVRAAVARACVPRELGDDVVAGGVLVGLLEGMVVWMAWAVDSLAGEDNTLDSGRRLVRLRTLVQLAALAAALQPFLMTAACLPGPPGAEARLGAALAGFSAVAEEAVAVAAGAGVLRLRRLAVSTPPPGPPPDAQVDLFARTIVQSARDNWVVGADGTVAVRKAGGGKSGRVSGPGGPDGPGGPREPGETANGLLDALRQQLVQWTLRPGGRGSGEGRLGRRQAEWE